MTIKDTDLMLAKNVMEHGQLIYKMMKDAQDIYKNVKESERKILAVGEFVVDFKNKYEKERYDRVSDGQVSLIRKTVHSKTTELTKILHPNLNENRTKGTPYQEAWFYINRGVWSIYKYNVNDNEFTYKLTPVIKYDAAIEYIESLTIADYVALREGRWSDIKKFAFVAPYKKDLTLKDIIEHNTEVLALENNEQV